jgi:hypothetical protein
MNLVGKYIKLINDSSFHVTGLILLFPPGIVMYLFFPNTEYTNKLIISGAICTVVTSLHTAIGIYALIKKEYEAVLNFLLFPACMVIFLAYLEFM